jgi:hypothetical protein
MPFTERLGIGEFPPQAPDVVLERWDGVDLMLLAERRDRGEERPR